MGKKTVAGLKMAHLLKNFFTKRAARTERGEEIGV